MIQLKTGGVSLLRKPGVSLLRNTGVSFTRKIGVCLGEISSYKIENAIPVYYYHMGNVKSIWNKTKSEDHLYQVRYIQSLEANKTRPT